jgi:hypothetical protein
LDSSLKGKPQWKQVADIYDVGSFKDKKNWKSSQDFYLIFLLQGRYSDKVSNKYFVTAFVKAITCLKMENVPEQLLLAYKPYLENFKVYSETTHPYSDL